MRTGGKSVRLAGMTAKITRINPEQLHETPGYHHITVVETGRTAYLAGQCPLDRSGSLVGSGSLEAQVDQVVANALIALAAVDAEPNHVVRSVIYVRSDDRDVLGVAWRRLTDSALGRRSPPPAHCWVCRSSASRGSSSKWTSPWHCPAEPLRLQPCQGTPAGRKATHRPATAERSKDALREAGKRLQPGSRLLENEVVTLQECAKLLRN